MINTEMTKKAMKLMIEKHHNQTDKAGLPYFNHPLHVAEQMNDEITTIVALLHDIVEDTDTTFEDLERLNFPKEAIDALRILTHDENIDYYDYIENIGKNEIARKVKIKDLEHNMDLRRLKEITYEDIKRYEKYKACHDYLVSIEKSQSIDRGEEMTKINFEKSSKITDAIFGLAIADAIGVPAEFKERYQLKYNPITDMIGYGTHHQPPGTWSDDSSMAIATMDSINECGKIDYDDIMKRFVDWARSSKYTATGVFFDIGITTSNAIKRFMSGIDATQCGETSISSNGNGSLMRITPVVLYSYYNNLNEDEEIELIDNISSLTHAHEISRLGCKIYCDYVKNILNGKTKEEAFDSLNRDNYKLHYSEDSIDYYNRILDGSLKNLEESEIKSGGFVVDTLEASIWANLKTENYKDAVLKAVNLGNDTDTVGAVTGSIAGILYGYENIPKNWRDGLQSKDYLMEICQKFDKTLNKENKIELI